MTLAPVGFAPLAVGLGAVWIAIAAALALIAARRMRRADALVTTARRLATLLAASPARSLLIAPDGKVQADRALLRDLGLATEPQKLDDLAGADAGIVREDLDALTLEVMRSALDGSRIDAQVRLASGRVFDVRGGLAPAPSPPRTILLWLVDTSRAESERSDLSRRLRQTENALDALTQLIESAPFPMWYRGPDLSLGLVNSAFVAAVEGRNAAEVIARGSELIESAGEVGAQESAQYALQSGAPYARNQPATIGGERRMLKLVDVPLPTGAVAGFALDIQDLEDARTELARNIRSQRELSDRMTAGAVQFDQDRRVDFFNQPFAIMAQIDPEWLSESPEFDRVLERMRENNRLPETRDFPQWKAERRDWFTSADELIEENWILANGDHLRVVGQPLPDGGLRMILEDRTEQVRLASSRDTLLRVRTATFDNLFEVISVFASDGRLYLWNRRFSEVWNLDEEWLGEHPRVDELVPALAKQLVNPTAAAQVREMVRSTTSGRRSGTGRVAMTDGRQFEFAAVPLPDGNVLFTMIDVTDSSRIEAALRERAGALEEADRVKTGFVANMSYELRTPLTSIGGFAEMLSAGYAGPLEPTARDYVAAITQSVQRLSKLIDDVLDLTQADTRGITLERERIDMAGLCRTTGEAMRPRAEEKKQRFAVEIDPSAGTVIGDVRRLRESIEHVLRNAIAYTDEGGQVALTATGDPDQVRITIFDNGPGISPEDQGQVFDRFHRVGSNAGRGGDAALGLGLPLARQFVEAHGGSIALESVLEQGTTVTLTIPRTAP